MLTPIWWILTTHSTRWKWVASMRIWILTCRLRIYTCWTSKRWPSSTARFTNSSALGNGRRRSTVVFKVVKVGRRRWWKERDRKTFSRNKPVFQKTLFSIPEGANPYHYPSILDLEGDIEGTEARDIWKLAALSFSSSPALSLHERGIIGALSGNSEPLLQLAKSWQVTRDQISCRKNGTFWRTFKPEHNCVGPLLKVYMYLCINKKLWHWSIVGQNRILVRP